MNRKKFRLKIIMFEFVIVYLVGLPIFELQQSVFLIGSYRHIYP